DSFVQNTKQQILQWKSAVVTTFSSISNAATDSLQKIMAQQRQTIAMQRQYETDIKKVDNTVSAANAKVILSYFAQNQNVKAFNALVAGGAPLMNKFAQNQSQIQSGAQGIANTFQQQLVGSM